MIAGGLSVGRRGAIGTSHGQAQGRPRVVRCTKDGSIASIRDLHRVNLVVRDEPCARPVDLHQFAGRRRLDGFALRDGFGVKLEQGSEPLRSDAYRSGGGRVWAKTRGTSRPPWGTRCRAASLPQAPAEKCCGRRSPLGGTAAQVSPMSSWDSHFIRFASLPPGCAASQRGWGVRSRRRGGRHSGRYPGFADLSCSVLADPLHRSGQLPDPVC
jgi:hypothetical protein